jgi:hypothetical protein
MSPEIPQNLLGSFGSSSPICSRYLSERSDAFG